MNPLARLALLALTFSPISMMWAQPLTTNPAITVQAGDTLEAISRKQGIPLAALTKLNPTVIAERLAIGTILKLPTAIINQTQVLPPELASGGASAALLLSAAERRDRAQQLLIDPTGWRWYDNTAVDWKGWRLHAGGVRITLVKLNRAELGNTKWWNRSSPHCFGFMQQHNRCTGSAGFTFGEGGSPKPPAPLTKPQLPVLPDA